MFSFRKWACMPIFKNQLTSVIFSRHLFLSSQKQSALRRATPNKDVIASKTAFLPNTAEKIHGRRQPYHGFFALSCEEIPFFEVLRSFEWKIFVHSAAGGRRNTCRISRTTVDAVGEKIHSKPATSLSGVAQWGRFGKRFGSACSGMRRFYQSALGFS